MPASVITRFPASRRNAIMERLSRRCYRLRGQAFMGSAGIPIAPVGRVDALEQLTVRLGIIPLVYIPDPTSLNAYIQAYAPQRPAGTETVVVSGGTAAQNFIKGNPLREVAFTGAGTNQPITATDSVDASATGRALVDVPA
jgi:hypothetical protein